MQASNLLIGAEPNTVWLKPELGTHGQTRRLRTSVDCSGLCEGKETESSVSKVLIRVLAYRR